MSLFPVVQNHLQHHHFTFKEGIRSVRNTTSMCTILQTPFSKLGNTLKNIFLFKTVKCKLQYLNIINRYKTLSSVSRHTTHKSLRSICPPSTMTRPQSGLKICICIAWVSVSLQCNKWGRHLLFVNQPCYIPMKNAVRTDTLSQNFTNTVWVSYLSWCLIYPQTQDLQLLIAFWFSFISVHQFRD